MVVKFIDFKSFFGYDEEFKCFEIKYQRESDASLRLKLYGSKSPFDQLELFGHAALKFENHRSYYASREFIVSIWLPEEQKVFDSSDNWYLNFHRGRILPAVQRIVQEYSGEYSLINNSKLKRNILVTLPVDSVPFRLGGVFGREIFLDLFE